MTTWLDAEGVVHQLTHVNPEKRAGRTGCSRYVEPWPAEVVEERAVTCLTCIVEPPYEEHIERDIRERGDEVVDRCRDHLYHTEEDGRCSRCGYFHKKSVLR